MAVSPQVDAVLTAVRELRASDPHQSGSAALVEDLAALRQASDLLAAAATRVLANAVERDAIVEVTGRAPRSFLVEELLVNPSDAARQLRLVHELPAIPATAAAYRDAHISAAHALVILKALHEVPVRLRDAVEAALLEASHDLAPCYVARLVDDILVQLGVDSSSDEAAARRHAQRAVNVAETFAGTGSLSGTLSPTLTDKLRRIFAQAAELGGEEDTRSAAQHRHDLLEDVVDSYLSREHHDDPDTGEPINRVIVTIDLDTLENELSTRWGTLDTGVRISPATARRLACDAEIIPAVLNSRGDILDIGVKSRSFSPAVRRGAKLRDGGRCGFPRCRRPIKECHHIRWWSRGGPSILTNAVWLCAFHHWLAHEGGWTLERNPDNSYTWTSPAARHVTGDPPHRHPLTA